MEAQPVAVSEEDGPVPLPADAVASELVRTGTDSTPRPELAEGERLLAGPVSATFTRVVGDGHMTAPDEGILFVTNRRLIQLSPQPRSIDLRRITELGLMANHILVTIARSRGLMIEVEGAPELRGVIAGAVSDRRKRRSELVPVMSGRLGAVPNAQLVEDVAHVPADRSG